MRETTLRYPNLKLWREDRRWSMREAAKYLGISHENYRRLESGEPFKWAKKAKAISEKTGVPLDVLAGVA